MKKLTTVFALLVFFAPQATGAPRLLSKIAKPLEHALLGAGAEISVSQAAGGAQKWQAGLLAAGITAGFKEGADAVAHRDTPKRAALHAVEIVIGAGAAALAWH